MADGFKWPTDVYGNRKSVSHFSDFEKVRYQIYLARIETTNAGVRDIDAELLYLQNWNCYFFALTQAEDFDPEALKYLQMEMVRLFKERVGWN